MNNIFKDAYFGKEYKTRDGNKALYLSQKTYGKGDKDNPFFTIVNLAIEKYVQFVNHEPEIWHEIITCDTEGNVNRFEPESINANDIVSKWQEPIDENHLDKLSKEYSLWLADESIQEQRYIDGFKAGYKAAKKGE